MIEKPTWWDEWIEYDENNNGMAKLKDDAPDEVKEEFNKLFRNNEVYY